MLTLRGGSRIRTSSPTVAFAVARAGRETISIGAANSLSLLEEGPTVRIRLPPAGSRANFRPELVFDTTFGEGGSISFPCFRAGSQSRNISPPLCAATAGEASDTRGANAKGISQEGLAYEAGINRTYVSKLEKGVSYPGLEIIAKLATVLEVEPAALIRLPARQPAPNT